MFYAVIIPYYMQYNIAVVCISFMLMLLPARSFNMQFDGTSPCGSTNNNFGIAEVGTLVVIMLSRKKYLQFFTIGSSQVRFIKMLKLPNLAVSAF